METATFVCSICSEASTRICVYCTKDACTNHLCDRCQRCSDCCQCGAAREASKREDANHTHWEAQRLVKT